MKGILVCFNEGPHPFPRGDNSKIAIVHLGKLEVSDNFSQTCYNASLGEGNSSLFKWKDTFPLSGDKRDLYPTFSYNHRFAQSCSLLGNVSLVSNVAHGPLVNEKNGYVVHCCVMYVYSVFICMLYIVCL